jgi:hypothetical protein
MINGARRDTPGEEIVRMSRTAKLDCRFEFQLAERGMMSPKFVCTT